MDAQQLHDYIIKPTLEHMDSLGGNYNTKEARFLLLCTAAIESNCGHYIKQVNGPALGIWQMEPNTYNDIWANCDALKTYGLADLLSNTSGFCFYDDEYGHLISSPSYACAMARLKYAMDSEALPSFPDNDVQGLLPTDGYYFWKQYKRIYNTELGDATFERWQQALNDNHIFDVNLGE